MLTHLFYCIHADEQLSDLELLFPSQDHHWLFDMTGVS